VKGRPDLETERPRRKKIVPVEEAPYQDAFEREFAPAPRRKKIVPLEDLPYEHAFDKEFYPDEDTRRMISFA
jgi:hypothetical protein